MEKVDSEFAALMQRKDGFVGFSALQVKRERLLRSSCARPLPLLQPPATRHPRRVRVRVRICLCFDLQGLLKGTCNITCDHGPKSAGHRSLPVSCWELQVRDASSQRLSCF